MVVAVDAFVQKIVEQGAPTARAACQVQRCQVGGRKADLGQTRHFRALADGQRCQRCGVALDRVGLQIEGLELLQPGFLVRREDAVGLAGAGEHLVGCEHHLVLARVVSHAQLGQRAAHASVAQGRGRLVVGIGIDRLHMQRCGQARQLLARPALAHDQADAFNAVRATEHAQLRVEVHQRVTDELHAAVRAGQRLEDVGVENEGHPHASCAAQRVMECGMVMGA